MMTHDNRAQAIKNLQRHLRELSYFDKNIPPVPIDGVFGTDTERAVRAFQESEDLPVTGRVDKATWDLLCDCCAREEKTHAAPTPLSLFPRVPEDYRVGEGDKQFLVAAIQYALGEICLLYDWRETPAVTGEYDAVTAEAVRLFQEKNGLPASGAVDHATWDALAKTHNQLFGKFCPQ